MSNFFLFCSIIFNFFPINALKTVNSFYCSFCCRNRIFSIFLFNQLRFSYKTYIMYEYTLLFYFPSSPKVHNCDPVDSLGSWWHSFFYKPPNFWLFIISFTFKLYLFIYLFIIRPSTLDGSTSKEIWSEIKKEKYLFIECQFSSWKFHQFLLLFVDFFYYYFSFIVFYLFRFVYYFELYKKIIIIFFCKYTKKIWKDLCFFLLTSGYLIDLF